jgi:hypothetical protein
VVDWFNALLLSEMTMEDTATQWRTEVERPSSMPCARKQVPEEKLARGYVLPMHSSSIS